MFLQYRRSCAIRMDAGRRDRVCGAGGRVRDLVHAPVRPSAAHLPTTAMNPRPAG
jgi:hypothetical protein